MLKLGKESLSPTGRITSPSLGARRHLSLAINKVSSPKAWAKRAFLPQRLSERDNLRGLLGRPSEMLASPFQHLLGQDMPLGCCLGRNLCHFRAVCLQLTVLSTLNGNPLSPRDRGETFTWGTTEKRELRRYQGSRSELRRGRNRKERGVEERVPAVVLPIRQHLHGLPL